MNGSVSSNQMRTSKRYLPNDEVEETVRVNEESFSQADELLGSVENLPNPVIANRKNQNRNLKNKIAKNQYTTNTTLETDESKVPMGMTNDSKLPMGTIRHGRFQSDATNYNSGDDEREVKQ